MLSKIVTIQPSRINKTKHHITYVNNTNYLKIRKLDTQHITHIGVDGIFFKIIFNIFSKYKKVERTSFDFTSNAPEFFQEFIKNNSKVCFIGGTVREIEDFKKIIVSKYSFFNRSGFYSGYISEIGFKNWDEYLQSINLSKYDVFVLGLGAPLQEKIINLIHNLNDKPSTITCGGFLSQCAVSNDLIYYPNLINKLNLRWLYRIFSEAHVLRRFILDYPPSIFIIIYDCLIDRFTDD